MDTTILLKTCIGCCMTLIFMAPPALASQPLVTDDTGTMGVMRFQAETGAEFGWDRETRNGSTTDATYQSLNLTLTAGILDPLDLVLTLPFSWQQVSVNGLKTYDNGGLNDLSLALKWRFLEHGPVSFAIKPLIGIPSGDYNRGLGAARPAYGATLISTVDVKPVSFSANAGYTLHKYTDADTAVYRESLWNLSLSCSVVLINGWQAVAEVATATNANKARTTWPTFITGGLIYSVLDSLDIDLGMKVGLNSPAPDFALLTGFTVKLP